MKSFVIKDFAAAIKMVVDIIIEVDSLGFLNLCS